MIRALRSFLREYRPKDRAPAAASGVTAPLGLRPEPVPVSAIRQVSTGAETVPDLLRLIDLRIGLDEALAIRKAKRPRRSARSFKSAHTRHCRNMAALRPLKGESQ